MNGVILKRKAYGQMLSWKNNSQGASSLLIDGARRTGKSFLAEEFAKNEYRSHITINFSKTDESVLDIFRYERNDLGEFFVRIQQYFNVTLYERESVIIFDEIQRFPMAREFIKFLVEDGRYDYIETGSLLSIIGLTDIIIPSEEDTLYLHPLDFDEFLWAMGDEITSSYIRECYESLKPCGDANHRNIMNRFREYMLVGGMPQAVLEYMKTRNFEKVDVVKRRILRLYRMDVTKFAKGYEDKVRAIFDSIPDLLSKGGRRFILSEATNDKNARARAYDEAFMWLVDARIVNRCVRSTDPSIGLMLNADSTAHKLYMADTGLLVTAALDESDATEEDIYRAIMFRNLGINEGMFAENVVAQMLVSSGKRLFFYSKTDRNDSSNTMEIDFLIKKGKKICPLEVKSSGYTSHSSLDKFHTKFRDNTGTRYIIYTKDLKVEDGIVHLPMYMAMLLRSCRDGFPGGHPP